MQQERTKTQNCTKITSTAIEDTCEYGGYVYMIIIIIEQVWAKKEAARKSNRCEVRERLGLING